MSDPDRHLHPVEVDEDRRMTPEALRIVIGDLHSRVAAAAARKKVREMPERAGEGG